MKSASLIAVILLGLIALGQLLRVAFHVQVAVEGHPLPMWPSIVACAVTGVLAVLLWQERR